MDTARIIWQICSKTSTFFLLVGFILSLRYYKKLGPEFRFFTLFLLLGLSTELFSFIYIVILNKTSNLFVIPIYYNLEFLIISCLYFKYFFKKVSWLSIIVVVLIQLALCIEGYRSIFFDQAYSFHAYGKVLVNFIGVIYCLRFFLELANGISNIKYQKIALNVLIFVYYVLSLIIFIFTNFLVNGDREFTFYFWIFYSAISFIFYFLISLLIWKIGTAQKLSLFGSQSF